MANSVTTKHAKTAPISRITLFPRRSTASSSQDDQCCDAAHTHPSGGLTPSTIGLNALAGRKITSSQAGDLTLVSVTSSKVMTGGNAHLSSNADITLP